MTFTLDLDIAAPPAKVFAFIADFTTTPRWYSAVQRVERVTGDGGIGSRYRVHRTLPGGLVANDVAVTEYTPDAVVTFTSVTGPTPFAYRYLIASSGSETHLTLQGSISGGGLPGPAALLGPFAERLFKRGMQDNLGTLARLLER